MSRFVNVGLDIVVRVEVSDEEAASLDGDLGPLVEETVINRALDTIAKTRRGDSDALRLASGSIIFADATVDVLP